MTALKTFSKVLETARGNLNAAGIIDAQINDLSQASELVVQQALAELNGILAGPNYKSFMSIYGLKPPEWWKNMEVLFQQTDTREHRLLKVEAVKLRKEWSTLKYVKAKRQPKAKPNTVEGTAS